MSTAVAFEQQLDALLKQAVLGPDLLRVRADDGEPLRWAVSRQARGFLIDRHPDGMSHIAASGIAHCHAYDPAFAEERARIVDHGIRRLSATLQDALYYLTVGDENLEHPGLPTSADADVMRGMYLLRPGVAHARRVQLLGSGANMGEVLKAAAQLEQDHAIAADIWSVTSYTELAREGVDREREWRHGKRANVNSWFEQQLLPTSGPIVAASDHLRGLPEMVRAFMPPGRRYVTLSAEYACPGDSPAARRAHSKVDAAAIVQASLRAVAEIMDAEKRVEQRRLIDVISLSSI